MREWQETLTKGHSKIRLMRESCSGWGVPVAGHKCEGPMTVLTFLSFEIDTEHLVVWLPN